MEDSKIVYLNLTSKYASSWETWEGIREFIQNWHDGIYEASDKKLKGNRSKACVVTFDLEKENENEIVYQAMVQLGDNRVNYGSLHYDISNCRLTLINRKVSLQKKILLLGYTSKTKSKETDVIGQFGEGLKVGALALVRQGRSVTMETSQEHWKFELHPYDQFDGEFGLVVNVSKSLRSCTEVFEEHLDLIFPPCPVRLEEEDTSTSLSSISLEEFTECREKFLFLTPPTDKVKTAIGTLLLDEKFAGKLFVKGSYILDLSNDGLKTGVDFCELKIDRDRNAVPKLSEIDHKVSCLWTKAVEMREDLASQYYALLEDHPECRDVKHATTYASDSNIVPKLVAQHFAKSRPSNAFPVSNSVSSSEVASLEKELGQPVVQINDTVLTLLHKSGQYKTLSDARAELKPKQEDIQPQRNLTKDEIKIIEQAVRVAKIVDPELKIEIIDVISSKKDEKPFIRGDRIEIPLWMLKTEDIHKYGQLCCPDGGKTKLTCWCRQIRLCNAMLSLRKDDIPDKIGQHPKEYPPDQTLMAILAQFTEKENEKMAPYCITIHQQGQVLDSDKTHHECMEDEERQRTKIKEIKVELLTNQKQHQEALANLNHNISMVRKKLTNSMVRDTNLDIKMEELERNYSEQLEKYKLSVQDDLKRKDEDIQSLNEELVDFKQNLSYQNGLLKTQEDQMAKFSKCLDHRHIVMVEKVSHYKTVLQKKGEDVKGLNVTTQSDSAKRLCKQVADTCDEICTELEGQAYMCLKCRTNQRLYMALPCCHYKFCEKCAQGIKGYECPVVSCNQVVQEIQKMFE